MAAESEHGSDLLKRLEVFELDLSRFLLCLMGIVEDEHWSRQVLNDPQSKKLVEKFFLQSKKQSKSKPQPLDLETALRVYIAAEPIAWHKKAGALLNEINDVCYQGLGEWLEKAMGSTSKMWVLDLQTNLKAVFREVVTEDGDLILSVNQKKVESLLDQLENNSKLLTTAIEHLSKNKHLFPKVVLRGQNEPPIVLGTEQPCLTFAQFNTVTALKNAGEPGLTKKQLTDKSGHNGALGILRGLKAKPGWNQVIIFPGTTGGRYKLL